MITRPLLDHILAQYSLRPWGTHGISHWARVLSTGRRLAETIPGALPVVELFAVFHDSRRQNEYGDYQHGLRGALLAQEMRDAYFTLSDDDFQRLFSACEHHTAGKMSDDPIIQACWDSDRLDLGRAGITPSRKRISAAAGEEEIYNWAHQRSLDLVYPDDIRLEWALDL